MLPNKFNLGLSFALVAFSTPVLLAQDFKMPSKEEVDKKVQEGLSRLPPVTAELEGVCKLTYKAIPSSPERIIEMVGGKDKLPPGVKPEQEIKQYMPVITQALQRNLAEAGEFEALVPIKVTGKTIPVGKHKYGFVFKDIVISAMAITVEGQKKPILIPFLSKSTPVHDELKLQIVKDPKKAKTFKIGLDFHYQSSQSPALKEG